MVKRRILLVDQDDQIIHTLAHALRRADFIVTASPDPHAALAALPQVLPDALIVSTTLPYLDGFEFVRRVKDQAAHEHVPVMFVTHAMRVEEKAAALELGVADYRAKPLVPAEVIAGLRTLLERPAARAMPAAHADDFSGDLHELDVAALCNMMESGRKSGTLELRRDTTRGSVFFSGGQVIDAEVVQLRGAAAVYQLLRWHEGTFRLNFGAPDRHAALSVSTHALLLEGTHRFDEWTRRLKKLPPLESVLHLQAAAVQSVGIDPTTDPVLHLVDGQRALVHILEASPLGDVETADALVRHLAAGHVAPAPTIRAAPPPAPRTAPPARALEARGAPPLASATSASLLFGAPVPPHTALFYGPGATTVPVAASPIDAPRTPEEAFGLPPAPFVDQSYLDQPLPGTPPWRRPLFWLWTTSLTTLTVGWLWNLTQR